MIFSGKNKNQSQVGFVVGKFKDPSKMLYGLSIINGDYSNIEELKNVFKKSTIPDEQPLFSVEKDPSELGDNKWNEFPFGFSYLCGEKRERNKNWFDWDDLQTLEDMRNGELLKFMKTRFEILKKYGIIEKL